MEIDRHNLPEDPALLRQMVMSLLEEAETKDRRLRQLQHWVEQLLRARFGPRRERVNENQLFLFAVALVSAGREAPAAPEKAPSDAVKRKGHGRQRLPKSLERRRVDDYTPTRSRDGPEEFLKAFRGYLQADAYSGYDHFYEEPERGIDEVACWAHARRKHYEAQSSDLMRATVMLAYIRLLYDVEREARDRRLRGEARRALRQKKSKPILDDIHAYLQREQPQHGHAKGPSDLTAIPA